MKVTVRVPLLVSSLSALLVSSVLTVLVAGRCGISRRSGAGAAAICSPPFHEDDGVVAGVFEFFVESEDSSSSSSRSMAFWYKGVGVAAESVGVDVYEVGGVTAGN